MFFSFDGTLTSLRTQIADLRAIALLPEAQLFAVAPRISGWSPAEHLDHTLKVSQSIVHRIGDAQAEASPRGISMEGRAVLMIGWIPRGVGRAPERLRGARATAEELEARIVRYEKVLAAVNAPSGMAARARIVPHPRFGGLTPAEGLRFAVVHNRHHLRIVGEVLRMSRAARR